MDYHKQSHELFLKNILNSTTNSLQSKKIHPLQEKGSFTGYKHLSLGQLHVYYKHSYFENIEIAKIVGNNLVLGNTSSRIQKSNNLFLHKHL